MGDGDHAFIRLLGEYGSLPSVPIFPHRYRFPPTIARVEAFGGTHTASGATWVDTNDGSYHTIP